MLHLYFQKINEEGFQVNLFIEGRLLMGNLQRCDLQVFKVLLKFTQSLQTSNLLQVQIVFVPHFLKEPQMEAHKTLCQNLIRDFKFEHSSSLIFTSIRSLLHAPFQEFWSFKLDFH